MRQLSITKMALILLGVCLLGGLFLNAGSELNAQGSQQTLLDILKPFINKEIKIAYRVGAMDEPATLKEVGIDYVVVESRRTPAQAIPLHAINSIVLGDVPQIRFGR